MGTTNLTEHGWFLLILLTLLLNTRGITLLLMADKSHFLRFISVRLGPPVMKELNVRKTV